MLVGDSILRGTLQAVIRPPSSPTNSVGGSGAHAIDCGGDNSSLFVGEFSQETTNCDLFAAGRTAKI
jgi:hypothetical protein